MHLRRILACTLLALTTLVALIGTATSANAGSYWAPKKPCGKYSLIATHAASAHTYDHDGDGWHCTGPRYYPRDNHQIPGSPPGDAYFSDYGENSEPRYVNTRHDWFTAEVGKPECDCTRERVFRYDRNDLFYLDEGRGWNRGSKLVSLWEFEHQLRSMARTPWVRYKFEVHYSWYAPHRSVYSVHPITQ